MNVRITPRDHRRRSDLYAGIVQVYSDGEVLHLVEFTQLTGLTRRGIVGEVSTTRLPLSTVAEIALDEDGGL